MAVNAKETNIVDNQDPQTQCPGNKTFEECATARELVKITQGFTPDRHLTALDETPHFNHLVYVPIGCIACHQICTIKLEMLDRQPTGNLRMASQPAELYPG